MGPPANREVLIEAAFLFLPLLALLAASLAFMTAPSVEYYLDRLDAPHHTAWFPSVAGKNIASPRPTPLDSLPAYLDDAFVLRRTLESAVPQDGAVWVFGVVDSATARGLMQEDGPKALTVEQVCYPASVLAYALVGGQPLSPVAIYSPDWVGGRRVVLRLPRSSWVPEDELPPIRDDGPGIIDTAP